MGPRHAGRPRESVGARRLRLFENGAYTLYTIYASSDPKSIGSGITSGCVGLLSQDMIHLYSQTPIKTNGRPACIGNSLSLASGPRCTLKDKLAFRRWRPCGVGNVFRADGTERRAGKSGRYARAWLTPGAHRVGSYRAR